MYGLSSCELETGFQLGEVGEKAKYLDNIHVNKNNY